MAGPNAIGSYTNNSNKEGELFTDDVLALDLSEDDTIKAIGNRLEQSEKFWNATVGLDKAREENEKYWMNTALDVSQFYDFQIPFKDNRIFIAVESLIPLIVSRPPQPIVTQAFETDASYELAKNLQKILLSKYEDLYLKQKFIMVVRHLLVGYRFAVQKYRWDTTVGTLQEDGSRSGDIAVDTIFPSKVVLDEAASDKDDIPLVGEYLSTSMEQLCLKFPGKKDEIYKQSGEQAGVKTNLSKKLGYVETWFTYYKDGQKKEGVAWKMEKILLDSMKNPNWNYDDENKNFFERPMKPYIVFNHLNLGKYIVDETSLSEQAQSQQDILNKRGRQIVENADSANSGSIYNSDMISQDDVAKLIGDPNEKVMVKGDVTKAAMRLPSNILPDFVITDKQDARASIDNTFGTHDPIRGEGSGSQTLGQDVISQRSDLSRTSVLATQIEDGGDRLYKGMVQMMTVFYDDTRTIKYTGPEGRTTFMEFSSQSIEKGISVRVKTGSVLPDDPIAREQTTLKIAPLLDPLSLGEGLNKDDPKEFAKRLMYAKMAPDKYIQEFLGEDPNETTDPQAVNDINQLNQGQQPPPQESPSHNHLAQHQAVITSPEFKQLHPDIQQAHIQHARAEVANAKTALGQPAEQPTPQNNVPPKGIPGVIQAILAKMGGGNQQPQ
jgi:hypothetical protein